jgi:hypothetical protein
MDEATQQPTGEEQGLSAPVTAVLESQKQSTGDTADNTPISMGQGPNANGEEDSKRQVHAKSEHTLGGVTKVLREELVVDPSKAPVEHVVQQGGGGVVKASGEPIGAVGTTAEAQSPSSAENASSK